MNNSVWLWHRSSLIKTLARLLLSFFTFVFCLAPYAFAKGLESQVAEEQYFVRALITSFFQNIVPFFNSAFVAFGLFRYGCHRLKLDN